MGRPKLQRNGEGKGEAEMVTGADQITMTVSEPPEAEVESPVKMAVFRSKDKQLALYQKAGYTDKSHGIATYIQSAGIQFVDHYFRIPDTKENVRKIAWIESHPSFGISFIRVPDSRAMEDLPPISELRGLSEETLLEFAAKRSISIPLGASKDSIVLSLLEGKSSR